MKDRINHIAKATGPTLVLGGTGKTGRRIVERLQSLGVPTRVASRSSRLPFDWDDQSTWRSALSGVSKAYISYAPDLAIPGATNAIRTLVDMAGEQGVQRLVLLSGRGEDEAQQCEAIVQESGMEWTIVRSSWFNQNFSEGEFLDMVLAGTITLPAADVPEPFVDADDIADVAVAALTEDHHTGMIYEVTGPRMLTFAEAVEEIARASGNALRYEQIPDESFAAGIADSGAPKDIVWLLEYLFSTVLDGRNAYVCDGVERALGRKPIDFSDYARKTADTGIWTPSPLIPAAVGL